MAADPEYLSYVHQDGRVRSSTVLQIADQNRARFKNSMARVRRDSVQTISNNTDTPINFDNEDFDTDSIHDNATNNTRLTVKLAGKYLIGGCLEWEANGNGTRRIHILKNGTTNLSHSHIATHASDEIAHAITTLASLAVDDYVELVAYQDSSGDLDVLGGDGECNFWMTYIGE